MEYNQATDIIKQNNIELKNNLIEFVKNVNEFIIF